ncbi:MAG: glycosyltransferase family 4 protein [Pseudonocardia sp.]|nr:glycosyltransferase family 4 protein [Pseudonocardia sp.]
MPETALIISATAPVPVDNGKRVVLHGLLEYLVGRLGPENVHYAIVDSPGHARPDFPGVAHRLDRPNAVRQLATLARRVPTDRSYTVQEAMFGSSFLRGQIHDLIAWLRPDIEVYDTLRLGQHAPQAPRGRRRILYLDDLFSVRYERMLTVGEQGDVDINPLGEFAANVPGPLRSLIRHRAVYRPVLRMERDRIRRAEARVVGGFDASLLVNIDEVHRLRRISGNDSVRVVHGMLPPVTRPDRSPAEPPELVFLGRLNIPHNDDAICSFIRAAMGELVHRHPHIRLRIIGKDPSDALLGLVAQHAPNIVLEGFVQNLDSVFACAAVSLAPLRFGSGVKIKMLDALARGVPTLATTVSVEGVPVAPEGENGCFVEDDLTRWPDLVDEMIEPTHNTQLSKAAVEFFESVYGREVVTAQYDGIFGLGGPVTAAP